ncbi:hypothetical protein Tco_1246633 [Tanacetum coccineum]
MTNKIDTVLKAITDQIAGALPSDTVKNLKLSTSSVLSPRSYPTKDPQCSTHIYGSINSITIHPKQQSDFQDDEPAESEEEEKDSLENTNTNPSASLDPSVLFIIEKFRNQFIFQIAWLGPKLSGIKFVCTKGDDGDVMFIEIVKKTDDSRKEEPKAGGLMHTKSVYLRNEEDKRRGVEYIMSKIFGFYKEFLELGPEYVTGMDDEGEVTLAPVDLEFKKVEEIPEVGIRLLFSSDGSLPLSQLFKEQRANKVKRIENKAKTVMGSSQGMLNWGPLLAATSADTLVATWLSPVAGRSHLITLAAADHNSLQWKFDIADGKRWQLTLQYRDDRLCTMGRHRNGATLPKITTVEGVVTVMPITTAEEKAQRRLELLEAVEKRFGGNAATRKIQRNLLKQQYENLTAPSSKMLDQTFDRLQKLVSKFELLDEKLSQEDVNQKLLRSLSPEWNTYVVVWRNKADLDKMSMDDLYNNLKVYRPEVKGMSSSINIADGVSTASTQVNAANSTNIDNLSDDVICAFFASQPNNPQLSDQAKEGPIYALMAFSSLSLDSEIVDSCKKGLGYENYNAVPPPYTRNFMPPTPDLSFFGLDEFVNEHVVKDNKAMSSKEEPKVVRKNDDAPCIKEWVSDNEEEDVS